MSVFSKQAHMLKTNGATVCQFRLNNGKVSEFGVMALKNGDIVKRNAWLSEDVSKKINTANGQQDDLK